MLWASGRLLLSVPSTAQGCSSRMRLSGSIRHETPLPVALLFEDVGTHWRGSFSGTAHAQTMASWKIVDK